MARHTVGVLLAMVAIAGSPACAGADVDPAAPGRCAGDVEPRQYPTVIDRTFVVGPVVLHTTQDSTTLMWQTADRCDGVVQYGPANGTLESRATTSPNGLVHKARIEGLEPNRRYEYKVSACSLETSTLSFHTAPPPSTPVRFTVWGDSQSHPERSTHVVAGMKKAGPHFTVHAGDEVGDGHDLPSWQTELFEPLRPLGHYVPTYAAIGNHEGNAEHFYTYSAYPHPPELADTAAFGASYSFVFGNVFFLVIDTNNWQFLIAPELEGELPAWIRRQLASAAAKAATWRFAVGHYPGYSESWGYCDESAFAGSAVVSGWLLPLLAEHGFAAYFAGHTHAYERGASKGVAHIVSGGGGGGLDQKCRDLPEVEVTEIRHHYLVVDASCDRAVVRAYDSSEDGTTPFDEVVLTQQE